MQRSGFSIVELLVAVAVIASVIALTFPAIQAGREASRRSESQNHLRQIGLACLAHDELHRHLPTGGWGWRWQGDPDRGFDRLQPGGWPYQLLPFLEQTELRESGSGLPHAQKRAEVGKVAAAPLALFHCPSRRAPVPYPYVHPMDFSNIDRPQVLARGDYSANVGSLAPTLYGPGPITLQQGDSNFVWRQLDRDGVIFRRSEVRIAEILDGASQTYLVAEGYLQVEDYETGAAGNDNQGLYVGYDRDTLRCTHPEFPPMRDRHGLRSDHSFGSAHSGRFHAALCDGSVRAISYNVAWNVHRRFGSRADGEASRGE